MAKSSLEKIRELVALRDSQMNSTPTSFGSFNISSQHSMIGSQTKQTNTLLLAEIVQSCISIYKDVADAALEHSRDEIAPGKLIFKIKNKEI